MLKPCARLTNIVARSSMQSSGYDMETVPYRIGQVSHLEYVAKSTVYLEVISNFARCEIHKAIKESVIRYCL